MFEGRRPSLVTYQIHLIRTGKTYAGSEKRYVGQADPPLCTEGVQGLEALLRECRYPSVGTVYTSPLQRCIQTADLLYPDTYTVPRDDLMDLDLGAFQGKSFQELRGDADFSRWLNNSLENPPPGGEDFSSFTQRITDALEGVFRSMMEDRTTSAAVVTHAGVIMTLLTAVGIPQLPIHQWIADNGCGFTVLMTPQMWMRDQKAEVYGYLPCPPDEELDG